MPLKNVHYVMRKMKAGGYERLAIDKKTQQVVEAKNMKTGATHTPGEFKADRRSVLTGKGSR